MTQRTFLIRSATACAVLILLSGRPADAQFVQYTAPGSLGEKPESRKERIETAMEEARWSAGPFKISPWIGLRNTQYVNNVFGTGETGEESDFTATVGAGLQFYLPIGAKVVWATNLLPEYTWWADLEERRRLNGRYGSGLFAYFNRLTLELAATRTEEQRFVTPEVEQLTNAREDHYSALGELQVYRSFYLFVRGEESRFENLLDEEAGGLVPRFDSLDREERVLRGGIRMRLGSRVLLGAGVEESEVEFEDPDFGQSNSGSSPYLELRYDGPTFFLTTDLVERSLEPEEGARFVPFEELTGSARLGLQVSDNLRPTAYVTRSLVYSVTALDGAYPYFLDERYGLSMRLSFARRFSLNLFGEEGTNDYTRFDATVPERGDDVVSYGGELRVRVVENLRLGLVWRRTDYTSNVPGFDRTLETLGFTFGLGEISWQ